MALTTPILQQMAAFDALQEVEFAFSVPTGGDQVTANWLTIVQQSSGAIVYQAKETTFSYIHTLPANTLSNLVGTGSVPTNYYTAYLQTVSASAATSSNSNSISFYCYSTPVLTFSNLPSGNQINNSSYSFQITYTQEQGELLNSYEINLYDTSNNLLDTSGVLYVGSTSAPPTVESYVFSGFADGTSYYIQAVGTTVNNTTFSSVLTQITVKYTTPIIYSAISLSQNCDGGYVLLESNLSNISGTSNPSPPTYIGTEGVDLTASGSYVNWAQSQFDLSGDFTLQIWGKNFTPNTNTITLRNSLGYKIEINYRNQEHSDIFESCFDCTVTSSNLSYYIHSNYIYPVPATTDTVQVWLRRIGNIYQLNMYNLG